MEPRTIHSPFASYPSGFPEEETMVEYCLKSAARRFEQGFGDTVWITNTETGKSCKMSEIEPLSRKIGSSFFRRGLQKNDIVLYSTHEPSFLHIFFLGVWRANGVLRPIYPGEDQPTILQRIVESKAKFFLCDTTTLPDIMEAIKKVEWAVELIILNSDSDEPLPLAITDATKTILLDDLLSDDGSQCPPLDLCGGDTAVLLSTSGTTGASKGCVHTHRSALNTVTCYKDWMFNLEVQNVPPMDQESDDRALVLGRPTHISGFMFPFSGLGAAKEILMMRNVNPANLFQAVHRYKPHLAFSFPTFLLSLVNDPEASKYDLTSIRVIITGGVLIHPSFVETMNKKQNAVVSIGFGMTEGAVMCSTRNFETATQNEHYNLPNVPELSAGKLVPGTLLQVRDLETGSSLPAGCHGELCYKSSLKCEGYLNRPEEDAKTFPDGWIRSGDIGYYDDNEFVFVVNRLKECFKYFNNHISPGELEIVILRHPAVDKVSVVGVPDPKGGDTIPRAFVTLKEPLAHTTTADDIRQFVDDNVADYKKLRGGLFILPEMPLGKTGKINTQLLKQMPVSFP